MRAHYSSETVAIPGIILYHFLRHLLKKLSHGIFNVKRTIQTVTSSL